MVGVYQIKGLKNEAKVLFTCQTTVRYNFNIEFLRKAVLSNQTRRCYLKNKSWTKALTISFGLGLGWLIKSN
jgi:hypothetical protein